MHYFIDGYNLFFRTSGEKKSLEQGRTEIITSLMKRPLSLTVVFDGSLEELPRRTHKGSIEIVYTARGQSADAYILEEISWVKTPKNYTVVTSDKKLASMCRAAGAHSQTIADFLSMIEKKEASPRQEKPLKESDKNLQRLLKIFEGLLRDPC